MSIVGLPDYNKVLATNLAVFLGCMLHGTESLLTFRPRWFDVPIVALCCAPCLSSLTNGLGLYDGLSSSFQMGVTWFLPYLVGRVFFTTAASLRTLMTAIVVGGLIYVPLCLFEVRMSPQLNQWVYGFQQTQFWRNIRYDGFRPVVFMQTGLMVGVWMATATAMAFCWWLARPNDRVLRIPVGWAFMILLVTTVLCKALYAILLMLLGLGLLMWVRWFRSTLPIRAVALAVPCYMILRLTGVLSTEWVTQQAVVAFGPDRAQSLEARLLQEELFAAHVFLRPTFGWAGWNRSWPVDEETGEFAVRGVDGMWISEFGKYGIFGLTFLFLTLLTPVFIVLWRLPPRGWALPEMAAPTVMAVSLLLFACDSLLNNMYNPIFALLAGGLSVGCAGMPVQAALRGTPRPALACRQLVTGGADGRVAG